MKLLKKVCLQCCLVNSIYLHSFLTVQVDYLLSTIWSILDLWLECQFLDTELDGSNPGSISMLCS